MLLNAAHGPLLGTAGDEYGSDHGAQQCRPPVILHSPSWLVERIA
jgi:hypothetical protein